MAEANPRVMEMVEAELKKNPDISNPELFERAKAIDSSVEGMTARQFNATYPLQVKRAMRPRKPAAPRKRQPRAKKRAAPRRETVTAPADHRGRDQVRKVLMELARDVAKAEGKGDVIDVIAGIDRYVDRVVKATS